MVGPPKKHSMVMVQLCQNHWKTIDGNGGLKKNINHSIALKNWPSLWSISGHTYVQKFWRCYIHVLDLELDWVISEVMQMLEYGTSMHMLEYCTSMYCHILVTFRKLKYLDLCSNTYHQRGWVWGFGLIQYTILDLTMGKFRAQGVHQTGQQSISNPLKTISKPKLQSRIKDPQS